MRKKIISLIIILSILILPLSISADGPVLILTTSRLSVERGGTVTIHVEVDRVPTLVCFGPIEIAYNSSRFTFKSASQSRGTGYFESADNTAGSFVSISMDSGSVSVSGRTGIISVTFEAKTVGRGDFTITRAEGFAGDDLVPIGMPTGAVVSVNVTEPVPKSTVNTLSALTVSRGTLTPAFSSGQLNYTISVEQDVAQLLVSASPTDSRARVSGGGTVSLNEGENSIQLVVTAESGARRTYTLIVTRASPTPSPSPVPTPAATITGPGGTFTVSELPEGVTVPAGFYSTVVTIDGINVPASKSLRGNLTLIYLTQEGGPSGFFYYNESTNEYLPFKTINLPALTLPVLLPDSGTSVPEGFAETSLDIDGISIAAWQREDTPASGEYLVYLMAADGEKGFFIYYASSRLLMPFKAVETVPSETTSPSETTAGPTETTEKAPEESVAAASFGAWHLLSLLLGLFSLVLLGLVIWLVFRLRKDDAGPVDKRPRIRRVS